MDTQCALCVASELCLIKVSGALSSCPAPHRDNHHAWISAFRLHSAHTLHTLHTGEFTAHSHSQSAADLGATHNDGEINDQSSRWGKSARSPTRGESSRQKYQAARGLWEMESQDRHCGSLPEAALSFHSAAPRNALPAEPAPDR